ncbi:MAG: CoA-binding protein [Leeuwenhoekiella sp.]
MKKTLVLGASAKPSRYSNLAIRSLLHHGKPVIAIGLREAQVHGIDIQTGQPELKDIHTVTMYINAKRQPEYYNYVLNLKPNRVIFNPGTENPEFYKILQENSIEVDQACTLVLLSTDQY